MSERFSLFHLDGERGLRGGERQLLYLAAHLRAAGHDNTVVCRRGFPLDRAARRQGLRVLNLPFLGEWDPVSAWRLHAAARAARHPAILHAHTGHTALLAAMAGRLGGHPWVVHRRVDFHLRSGLSRRWKYDAAWRVIAVSESIRGVLKDDGVAAERVTVIPDCLPITAHEAELAGLAGGPLCPPENGARSCARRELAQAFGLPDDAPWIGNLAALVPHKDQATLLRSIPFVRRSLPNAHFAIIGDGPLAAELRNLAADLGVQDAVVFTGYVPDPRPWLQALDVYVQSSWGEGMGSVLLEAMACRIPIVATTAGGIPEVVEHGRTALLVEPRSPERLGRAIADALIDRDGAARRARAARQDLDLFSLSRVSGRIAALYGELRPEKKP
ncbi:MAG: glycosyltransferase [Elusimicrobiota bacterium]